MRYAGSTTIALLLTLISVMPVSGKNGTKEQSEPSQRNQQIEEEMNGQRKRDIACSCCKMCMAAKSDVRGKEEGPPAKNGCRDCCRRCGTVPHDQRKMPPEIVK